MCLGYPAHGMPEMVQAIFEYAFSQTAEFGLKDPKLVDLYLPISDFKGVKSVISCL